METIHRKYSLYEKPTKNITSQMAKIIYSSNKAIKHNPSLSNNSYKKYQSINPPQSACTSSIKKDKNR